MPRVCRFALTVLLAASVVGCLATRIDTPRSIGRPISAQHVHVLAAPFRIDAHMCDKGIARATTFVPLWGVVVGVLTVGILVPKATTYHCVEGQ